ncbi:MAG: hypothetical protein DMG89_26260 [Acidobacteria bacterium]|nr:MAG: hypothetical protein DMG89_26260 [Acidobacteriota bacterium]
MWLLLHHVLLPVELLNHLLLVKPVIDLQLVESIDHGLDRSRFRMQLAHGRNEALMPHHFFDESRVSRLGHCHRAECVPGAVELQFIRNFELAGNLSEPQLNVTQGTPIPQFPLIVLAEWS